MMLRVLSPILLALVVACGGAGGDKVDQAVTIAKELQTRPDDAEKIGGALLSGCEPHVMALRPEKQFLVELADLDDQFTGRGFVHK